MHCTATTYKSDSRVAFGWSDVFISLVISHFIRFQFKPLLRFTGFSWILTGVMVLFPPMLAAQTIDMDVISDYRTIRLVAASTELVYFLSSNGILRFNKGSDGWDKPLPKPIFFRWDEINGMEGSTFGDLFVQTDNGWYVFDPVTNNWFSSAAPDGEKVYEIISPPDNLQAPNGAVMISRNQFLDVTGRTVTINQVIDDRSGTYWIATSGAGPARTRFASGVIDLIRVGLAQPRVDVITKAGDSVWVGGLQSFARGGITAISNTLSSFNQIVTGSRNALPRIDLQSLLVVGDTLYCGTEQGIQVVLPEIQQVVRKIGRNYGLPSERVTSLARSGDSLFVGTDFGVALLWSMTDSSRLIRPSTIGNSFVYDLELVDDRLWITTDRGVYRWRSSDDHLQTFLDSNKTLFSRVYQMTVTDDRLWFVSQSSIVWLDRTTGDQGLYREAANQRRYRAIAANDRFVAASTDRGVIVLSYRAKKLDSREVFVEDGLPSSQVIALAYTDDFLWIGTDDGLARIDCSQLGLR